MVRKHIEINTVHVSQGAGGIGWVIVLLKWMSS